MDGKKKRAGEKYVLVSERKWRTSKNFLSGKQEKLEFISIYFRVTQVLRLPFVKRFAYLEQRLWGQAVGNKAFLD